MKKAISILLCAALAAACCAVSAEAAQLHPFSDVVPGSWYEQGVIYAYENGLMVGTSQTEFSPNADTTRAMIVTILYRELHGIKDEQHELVVCKRIVDDILGEQKNISPPRKDRGFESR